MECSHRLCYHFHLFLLFQVAISAVKNVRHQEFSVLLDRIAERCLIPRPLTHPLCLVGNVLFWSIYILSHLRSPHSLHPVSSHLCLALIGMTTTLLVFPCCVQDNSEPENWPPIRRSNMSNVTKQLLHSWGGCWMYVRTVSVLGFDMFPNVIVP